MDSQNVDFIHFLQRRVWVLKGEIPEFSEDLQISFDGFLCAIKLLRSYESGSCQYHPVRSPLQLFCLILTGFAEALQRLDDDKILFFSYDRCFENVEGRTALVFLDPNRIWEIVSVFFKMINSSKYNQFLRIHQAQ